MEFFISSKVIHFHFLGLIFFRSDRAMRDENKSISHFVAYKANFEFEVKKLYLKGLSSEIPPGTKAFLSWKMEDKEIGKLTCKHDSDSLRSKFKCQNFTTISTKQDFLEIYCHYHF